MLYTTEANVPVYGKNVLLLDNGVDLKKSLSDNSWQTTVIELTPGVSASVTPDSDASGKRGAVNFYTVRVANSTRKIKYLRQVHQYLNDCIALYSLKTAPQEDHVRILRGSILSQFKTRNWGDIRIMMPCGLPCTISAIRTEQNGKTSCRYHASSSQHVIEAGSLLELARLILDASVKVPVGA